MVKFGIYKVISATFSFIMVMLLVAFFILSERKILGYIQLRKGPNKVGLLGLLQSFADFIKLLTKGLYVSVYNRSWYSIYCVLAFTLMGVIVCCLYSFCLSGTSSSYWLLWVLVVGGVVSHCIVGLAWGSYNKYSILSCIRFAFVSMSFEACFMCIVLIYGFINGTYEATLNWPLNSLVVMIVPCSYGIWLIVLLGECNRVPFDYGEAESELVSGLNVEYSGLPFIAIFACEYLLMFFFSWLTCLLFWGGYWFWLLFVVHLIFFAWCRASLPRIRFDTYVSFMWEICLTTLLFSLLVVIAC